MVTEADFHHWSVDGLRPYVETVLEAFGPQRLLFGSDWPVCTVAASYVRWASVVSHFIASLSLSEQGAIMGGNATKTYNIP
jgi:L-fuconolactonase